MVAVSVATLVAVCDDPIPPAVPTTVTVSPSSADLAAVGETVKFTATVKDQDGNTMTDVSVTWSSSAREIATVDAAGLVTAAGNGRATITARAETAAGDAAVTVEQVPAAVSLAPDSLAFSALGDSAEFMATVTDANGHTIDGAAVTWSSGDPAVARVDQDGLVSSTGNGRTAITARAGAATGSAAVTVEQIPADVMLDPDSLAFAALGDTATLEVTVVDANGHPIVDAGVVWSSGDTDIASVTPAGLVSSAGNGITTVAATSGDASGTATVTVEQVPAAVTLAPDALAFTALGDTTTLAATVLDANGHVIERASVEWASDDRTIADVTANGLVTAAGNGSAEITATSGEAAGTVAVTVEQVPAAVTLAPGSLAFTALGDTATLAATVLDANGHAIEGATVVWSNGDPGVATVNASGLVTAAGNGRATITATSGQVVGTVAVTVEQVAAAVTLAPGSLAFAALGDTATLAATVLDANGHVIDGAGVTWSSNDATIATVNSSGLVTAAGNGRATITAASGSAAVTAAVAVDQVLVAIAVAPDALTFTVIGDTARLAATATDANGYVIEGAAVTWSSNDHKIATVDTMGLVTTAGNGRATITAMSGDVSGTAAVTVQQAPDTVTLAPGSLGFSALEDTATLVATVLDANGHAIEGAVVTWSSDNNAIATVNASGLVTAAGNGEAMVTAVSGGVPGTAAVTVEQKADSVSVSPNAATMAIGETVRLTALAFDANGHKMVGAQFKWGSSDALIASVDGNGLVRGTGEGTAAITAQNGSALGSAEVTVGNPDRAVLVALYHSTGGDQWANNQNWLQNTPLGHWHGVETDQQGYVTSLDLRSNGLDGSIPPRTRQSHAPGGTVPPCQPAVRPHPIGAREPIETE